MGIFDFFRKNKETEEKFSEIKEKDYTNEMIKENNEFYKEVENYDSEYIDIENITLEDIKNNIENLQGDLVEDPDIICLKVLCSVPEENKDTLAIRKIIQHLSEKYSEEEINSLFFSHNDLELSFQEIIEILEMSYPTNSEMIILKALLNAPETLERDKAIIYSLEKMLVEYPLDPNIKNCLLKLKLALKNSYSSAERLIYFLGGEENIITIDSCTTRIRLEVKDSSIIDDKEIKKLVCGILKPNKTNAQIIIGLQARFVADEMKKILKLN